MYVEFGEKRKVFEHHQELRHIINQGVVGCVFFKVYVDFHFPHCEFQRWLGIAARHGNRKQEKEKQ